jgi:hypothetical protein
LTRLRTTAFPTRELTVTPRRDNGRVVARRITTRWVVCRRRPSRWRPRNSRRRRSRAAFGKVRGPAMGSPGLLRRDGNRQTPAPFGSPALQHLTSAGCRHAGAKAVRPLTPTVTGLIGSLHSSAWRGTRDTNTAPPQSQFSAAGAARVQSARAPALTWRARPPRRPALASQDSRGRNAPRNGHARQPACGTPRRDMSCSELWEARRASRPCNAARSSPSRHRRDGCTLPARRSFPGLASNSSQSVSRFRPRVIRSMTTCRGSLFS